MGEQRQQRLFVFWGICCVDFVTIVMFDWPGPCVCSLGVCFFVNVSAVCVAGAIVQPNSVGQHESV
jgi:hypothetical protein